MIYLILLAIRKVSRLTLKLSHYKLTNTLLNSKIKFQRPQRFLFGEDAELHIGARVFPKWDS